MYKMAQEMIHYFFLIYDRITRWIMFHVMTAIAVVYEIPRDGKGVMFRASNETQPTYIYSF